jgi:hypothetical protein
MEINILIFVIRAPNVGTGLRPIKITVGKFVGLGNPLTTYNLSLLPTFIHPLMVLSYTRCKTLA